MSAGRWAAAAAGPLHFDAEHAALLGRAGGGQRDWAQAPRVDAARAMVEFAGDPPITRPVRSAGPRADGPAWARGLSPADPGALAAAFAADGFVRVGPALDPAGCAEVAAAADRALDAVFTASGMHQLEDWAARVTLVPAPEAWEPAFEALAQSPGLAALAAAALGAPAARCLWAQLVIKPPGVGAPLPWHTDRPTWPPIPGPCLALWLALDPAGPTRGGLRYAVGSHRGAPGAELAPDVPQGWALLHHPDVLHRSGPNPAASWRRAWLAVYAAEDAPQGVTSDAVG